MMKLFFSYFPGYLKTWRHTKRDFRAHRLRNTGPKPPLRFSYDLVMHYIKEKFETNRHRITFMSKNSYESTFVFRRCKRQKKVDTIPRAETPMTTQISVCPNLMKILFSRWTRNGIVTSVFTPCEPLALQTRSYDPNPTGNSSYS